MTPAVGDELPAVAVGPLTRSTLALYAGGSGDHIPLHIDADYAKAAGYPDQFMHGMLGVAYITRVLTAWAPQEALRAISVRFSAITYPGESLVASASVTSIARNGDVELRVALKNTDGETKIEGKAMIAPLLS